jgi:hypothetical protein
MLSSFIFPPWLGMSLALVIHLVFVVRQVWSPEDVTSSQPIVDGAIYLLRSLGRTTYIFIALLCIDSAFTWFAGGWGFALWRYHFPQVLVALVIGVELLWIIIFARPTVKRYLFLAGMALGYVVAFRVIVPLFDNLIAAMVTAMAVLVFGGFALAALTQVFVKVEPGDVPTALQKVDGEALFHKIFSPIVLVVILAVAMIQTFLTLYGYSLFAW